MSAPADTGGFDDEDPLETHRRFAGLLDTDGEVTANGSVQLCVTRGRLVRDVEELVVGLGYRFELTSEPIRCSSRRSSTAFTLTFATDEDVFGLYRKALQHKQRRALYGSATAQARSIVAVRRIDTVPVRCSSCSRHNVRKATLVTPAIGARMTGEERS